MNFSIHDIRVKYDNKEYEPNVPYPSGQIKPEGFVFDENLSVKQNRDMVEAHNNQILSDKKTYRKAQADADKQLRDDLVAAMIGEYHFGREVAERLYDKLYNDDHSPMSDFLSRLEEYSDLVAELFQLQVSIK